MKKKISLIIGMLALVVMTSVVTLFASTFFFPNNSLGYNLFAKATGTKSSGFDVDKLDTIKKLVDQQYYKPIDQDKLFEGTINGMLKTLNDPYTTYLNKKQFEDLMTQTNGTYAGIGVVVTFDKKDNSVLVVAPIEGTPGEKAGILPEDKILKVNDKQVYGDKLDEAVTLIKGPKGTSVNLTVRRRGVKDFTVSLKRANIVIKSVKSRVINDNIGYIKITSFDTNTSKEFLDAYDQLSKSKLKGLIIDVRNNPGGLLDQVERVADRLLPKGTIVYTQDKSGKKEYSYSDEIEIKLPIAVLINGNSASASEILAGALKDTKKGALIGTKSFGKGVVQQVIPFADGTALKVTVSEYFTPNGINIHGKGIQPDIEVKLPDNLKNKLKLSDTEDIQLKRAIDYITTGK